MARRQLTSLQSEQIREMYTTGHYSARELAQLYDVSTRVVSKAVTGVTKGKFTAQERFEKLMDKRADEECWEWTGTHDRDGYGRFWINGKTVRAHRVSYTIYKRPIPVGQLIRHTCDNPTCVNPKHLVSGTHRQNVDDMIKRGRNYKGGSKPKLNELEILEARFRLDIGVPQHDVSKRLGVTGSTLTKALKQDPLELRRRALEKEHQGRSGRSGTQN